MARPDRPPLLHGPYVAPALQRGDRAHCLVRDCEVVTTTWTDAPISWPRGYAPSEKQGGGPGIVVEAVLALALRCESAAAIASWWRVSGKTVAKWRRALGVTRTNNEGSQVLIRAATAKALEAALEAGTSEEERERRSRLARDLKPWRFAPRVTFGKPWTAEQEAVLGTVPDSEAARRTGHTLNGVRMKRRQVGIPRFPGGRRSARPTSRGPAGGKARISVRGKQVSLGAHDTKEEANQAYKDAVRRFLG